MQIRRTDSIQNSKVLNGFLEGFPQEVVGSFSKPEIYLALWLMAILGTVASNSLRIQ